MVHIGEVADPPSVGASQGGQAKEAAKGSSQMIREEVLAGNGEDERAERRQHAAHLLEHGLLLRDVLQCGVADDGRERLAAEGQRDAGGGDEGSMGGVPRCPASAATVHVVAHRQRAIGACAG